MDLPTEPQESFNQMNSYLYFEKACDNYATQFWLHTASNVL